MEKSITKQTPAAYSDASMSGTSFRARRHQRAGRGDRTRTFGPPTASPRAPTATSVLIDRCALPSGRSRSSWNAWPSLAALRTVAAEDSLVLGTRGAFAASRYILTPAFPSGSSTAIITLVPVACLSQGAHNTMRYRWIVRLGASWPRGFSGGVRLL